jgi:2-oxoglutarate dehydrogenase E1 component
MSNSPSNGGNVYVAYQANSYLFGGNAPYVEEMYEKYLDNPGSVPENWRGYFDALQHVPAVDGTDARDVPHQQVINAFAERAKQGGTKVVVAAGADSDLAQARCRPAADRGLPQRRLPLGRFGPAQAHRARPHSRT